MPFNRITQFLRAAAEYRVEACFLAALVFTLGHQSFHHDRIVEVRTAKAHETVVHKMTPVRIAAARRNVDVIELPGAVGIAVPAPRYDVVSVAGSTPIVAAKVPVAPASCASLAEVTATPGSSAATCRFIRIAPVAGARVAAKTFVKGS